MTGIIALAAVGTLALAHSAARRNGPWNERRESKYAAAYIAVLVASSVALAIELSIIYQ